MRDHFDPLAPLLYQNHDHPNPHHGSHNHNHSHSHMQGQGQIHHQHQHSQAVRSSVHNPFGNGFSNTADFSAVAVAPGSVGEKRNNSSDENLDCNLLQSSLKRVRLSRSPGEFRLQRDVKTLDAMQWGSSHVAANALNFSATTWIHRATGARLSMVDSLRICMFLPITAIQQKIGQYSTDVNPEQQYQHQLHSYHRDYRWRIMIQIPRMYPHSPPVVTRIDGLSLDSIVINQMSPGAQHNPTNGTVNGKRKNKSISDGSSSVHSNPGVTASESFFFTEAQLDRSTSSRTIASAESQNTTSALSMVGGSGKKIEWNKWSPITDLGELLDFLLGVAISNLSTPTTNMNAGLGSTTTVTTSTSMMGTKIDFNPSVAVTTARLSSSSSSSLSSVSSASSISSWGNRNSNNNNNHDINNRRAPSFLHRGGNNTVAETMMSDENATTSSSRTNVSGASFLSPNRFDVGYGKSDVGKHRFAANATAGMTPLIGTTSFNDTSAWQPPPLDDVGMDMS